MSAANNGGPAFPIADGQMVHAVAAAAVVGITDPAERDKVYIEARAKAAAGMTLRDAAAIQAMAACVSGHITHFGHDNHWPPIDVAQYAYELADAMLRERAK